MRAEAPRVAVRTLGCKVNRSESEALAEALAAAGIVVVGGDEAADAVVVNTCTVTGEADAKARKEVRRALRSTAGPVVVTGCLAAIDGEGLRLLGDRVEVQSDRRSLAATVASLVDAAGAPSGRTAAAPPSLRTRALVKIQDGCDNRCSYCIVPDARGVPVSVPTAEIVERVEALRDRGTAEVVLTGVNIGRYRDARGAPDLAGLVEQVAATGVSRIRVSSIEPTDLGDRFLAVLAATTSVATHLHVPLQSGCDSTLASMGRRYTASRFADAVGRARAALPGLAVTTDVIVGFPGESDEDFAESASFIERMRFAKIHVFRYSKRSGTPAAQALGQVPDAVKAARAEVLREIDERSRRAHARGRAGGRAELLVESVRDGVARGTTEDHLRIPADLPEARPGDLVPVSLALTVDGDLRGYYVEEDRAPA